MSWFKVARGVMTELFPVLSIALRECVEDKLSTESTFKVDQFGEDAVKDIVERLKLKRTLSDREVVALKALIQRAVDHGLQREEEPLRLVIE